MCLQSDMAQKVRTAFSYLGVKASFPPSLQRLIIKRLKMRSFPGCANERGHAETFTQKVLLNRGPLMQMWNARRHKCPPPLKRVFRGHPQGEYKRHRGDIDSIFIERMEIMTLGMRIELSMYLVALTKRWVSQSIREGVARTRMNNDVW
jgi:hypothetical protein